MKEDIQKIIDKFPNGQERMRESALFNMTMHAMAHGESPESIINKLINLLEGQGKMAQELLMRLPIEPMKIEYAGDSDAFTSFKREIVWHGKVGMVSPNIGS